MDPEKVSHHEIKYSFSMNPKFQKQAKEIKRVQEDKMDLKILKSGPVIISRQ